jgi:segregation and condensation protein B
LIRVIGKKEEVGRPILYGTTPEFLKTFSLRDLTDLPTLREFHELGAAERAEVDATLPGSGDAAAAGGGGAVGGAAGPADATSHPGAALRPTTVELPNVDPDEEEALLEELEQATQAAGRATAAALDPKPAQGGDGDAQPAVDAARPSHGGEG